jgi:hypothetical protein
MPLHAAVGDLQGDAGDGGDRRAERVAQRRVEVGDRAVAEGLDVVGEVRVADPAAVRAVVVGPAGVHPYG